MPIQNLFYFHYSIYLGKIYKDKICIEKFTKECHKKVCFSPVQDHLYQAPSHSAERDQPGTSLVNWNLWTFIRESVSSEHLH